MPPPSPPVTVTERELNRPAIPGAYVVQWLDLLSRRGVAEARVLEGTGMDPTELAREDTRVTPIQFGAAIMRGIGLTGDPTLGYAFGLEMKPTAHGFFGYAAMTCATLADAIALGERYLRLRVPRLRWKLSREGEVAVLALQDEFVPGPFRQFWLEVITAAISRTSQLMLGQALAGEIWVDYPEPPYYARMRDKLPPVRFSMPMNALRFPRADLERGLSLADPVASRDAVARLERELSLLGELEPATASRVRALLASGGGSYPDLAQASKLLGMSERSVKRKLQAEGTSFQKLLDEARLKHARALLRDQQLSVDAIAARLGYADPANFTRAFRRWTGETPRAFRRSSVRPSRPS